MVALSIDHSLPGWWLDGICRRQTDGVPFAAASEDQLRGVIAAAWTQLRRRRQRGVEIA